MAHSIQTFGDKDVLFSDLDLLPIVGLVLHIVSAATSSMHLQNLRHIWHEALRGYGPGVLDLKLEALYGDTVAIQDFRILLREVKQHLATYSDGIVPAHVLNSVVGIPGVLFYPRPAASLVEVVEKLERLVEM